MNKQTDPCTHTSTLTNRAYAQTHPEHFHHYLHTHCGDLGTFISAFMLKHAQTYRLCVVCVCVVGQKVLGQTAESMGED